MVDKQVRLQPKPVSQQQYILLLGTLFTRYRQGEFSEDAFTQLLHSLVAEDLCGTLWTFTPPTGEWWIVTADAWEAGAPRGPLLLALSPKAARLMDEIGCWVREIQDSLPPPRPLAIDPQTPAPAPAKLFCTACGHQLKPGTAYCSRCGRAVG